jgi:hypothetical protein
MRAFARSSVMCLTVLAGCSSSSAPSHGTPGDDGGAGDDAGVAEGGGGATLTEHGIVYDYGTLLSSGMLSPVQGLTVTDGSQTTTTDAMGNWSLTLPIGATVAPVVNGTVKGDPYSNLMLPQAIAAGADAGTDLDRGNIIIPDQSTFSLERLSLSADSTKAIVHVLVLATGACTSVAGGTLAVTSPAGAQVMYFDTTGYPTAGLTSFADLSGGRPVADVYNATPGAPITVQVTLASCHQAAYPVDSTGGGGAWTGQVTTQAAEPGDNNSALVVIME